MKVSSKKLDAHSKLLVKLHAVLGEVTASLKKMTDQERTLAGPVMVEAQCPWDGMVLTVLMGEKESIAVLVSKAVSELQKIPAPVQHSLKPDVFTKKSELN